MKIITDETEYTGAGAVLALGMFDGVHLGHRSLIARAAELARETGADLMVCTFDRHPLSVIRPGFEPKPLTDLDERLRIFESLGADVALVKPFTRELADMDAPDFLERLTANTRARAIVCGENYTFGRGGAGNADTIRAMAGRLGYRAEIAESVAYDGEAVSSTMIRRLIAQGDIGKAKKLMGL